MRRVLGPRIVTIVLLVQRVVDRGSTCCCPCDTISWCTQDVCELRWLDEIDRRRTASVAVGGISRNWLGPQVPDMLKLKDTERSQVSMTFDGCVVKQYRGHLQRQRMENEIRVLEHLKRVACPFVPRLVSFDRSVLQIVVTACGVAATHVSPAKLAQLFQELREYGVEHEDAELRNITYDARAGQFCVIDFEFARIIDLPERQFTLLDSVLGIS